MAGVTLTFRLMKFTEWTFTHALECHTSRLIKKVCWSYSCVYLRALALAEMFGSVRIKSNCVEVTGGVKKTCNLKLFHSAIFSYIWQRLCFSIAKKTFCPRSLLSEQEPRWVPAGFIPVGMKHNPHVMLQTTPQNQLTQSSSWPWNIELILDLDSEDCTKSNSSPH